MDNNNPYAAPTTSSSFQPDLTERPAALRIASQGARFGNMIIDLIVFYALSFIVGAVLGIVYALRGGDPARLESSEFDLLSTLLGWGVYAMYYIVMEFAFQRTIGKLVTGTMVVTATGNRPSFGQIVGRALCRFIPFEAFSFFGGNGKPVGWHDSISGTRVVTTR